MINSVKLSTTDFTTISCPSLRQRLFTMYKPIPVDFACNRPFTPVKDFSKIYGKSLSGIPMPLSQKCSIVLSGKSSAQIVIIDSRSLDDVTTDEVAQAILDLPEKLKLLIHLTYYEGKTSEEVARIVGTSASTVRSHLSEARSLIGSRLKGMRI